MTIRAGTTRDIRWHIMVQLSSTQAFVGKTQSSALMQARSTTIDAFESNDMATYDKMLRTFSITLATLVGVAMLVILARLLVKHRRIMVKEEEAEMQSFDESSTRSKMTQTDEITYQV